MFRIEPTALYTLDDLERELAGGISARAFLDKCKPTKRFKNLWLGEDLIEAVRSKKPHNEADVLDIASTASAPSRSSKKKPGKGKSNGNVPIFQE